jgi:hypothetical protein
MDTLRELVEHYDQQHEFLRRFTIPEEDRAKYTSARWNGGYRWFRSPNVLCLEKFRQLKMRRVQPRLSS